MSTDLTGRVAIVTGGGRGIGRATAIELARMGAAVAVSDIGQDEGGRSTAELVAGEIRAEGARAIGDTGSILEDAAVAALADRCERELGGLDILVNNAGIAWNGKLWECDPETFERVSSIHIRGAFNCTRHAALRMKDRGWGRIVNLVSRAGITGLPDVIPYGVGKGAMLGLTNAASRDLGPLGITVNAVNPSSTLTPMVAEGIAKYEAQGEAGRQRAAKLREVIQQPEQVAVVIAALCTEAAGHINGQVFMVERNQVGLFQPLVVVQSFERGDEAGVGEMATGLGKFEFPDLSDAYK
jgi:NAD(P)-dependent dehydrogenase (short-subunit alcohol dehydrogenase family)